MEYDVATYRQYLLTANAEHNNNLIPIIRIIKTWNRLNGHIFDGYYLELLITDLLITHKIEHYSKTIHYIFQRAAANVAFIKHDPANPAITLQGLLDIDNLVKIMIQINQTYDITSDALENEQLGNNKAAFECWRKLFPGYFPSDIDMVIGQLRKQGIEGPDALKLMLGNKLLHYISWHLTLCYSC